MNKTGPEVSAKREASTLKRPVRKPAAGSGDLSALRPRKGRRGPWPISARNEAAHLATLERRRECFRLRTQELLTFEEIGKRIGVSKTRAHTYYREKAQELLESQVSPEQQKAELMMALARLDNLYERGIKGMDSTVNSASPAGPPAVAPGSAAYGALALRALQERVKLLRLHELRPEDTSKAENAKDLLRRVEAASPMLSRTLERVEGLRTPNTQLEIAAELSD